jgi:hypothetical protein
VDISERQQDLRTLPKVSLGDMHEPRITSLSERGYRERAPGSFQRLDDSRSV